MLYKGSIWSKLSNVIRKLEETKKTGLIDQMKTILATNGYIPVIIKWICANIDKVDEATLKFVDIVNTQQKNHETFTSDMILIQFITMS